MRLIQPLKFRTLKTGCYKIPHLQAPRLQTGVFQTGITVSSGLYKMMKMDSYNPEATVTLTAVWKRGVSKRGILKSPVSHVPNFLGYIKLIFDTSALCNFVINSLLRHSPEATVTLTAIWKWGVSMWGILKSPVSHVLNLIRWI